MRINHNIPAMITQGSLAVTNRAMGKNLERLSSGLRINRAADDAAGLGVSENLRTQVRGTAQATKNAQDGIAALNIAEGASNEISAILQRMRELAIQSSNDTLTATERGYLDTEFQALIEEIDRISDVTNYNGQSLLDGAGFGGATSNTLWVDANDVAGDDSITVDIDALDTASLGIDAEDITDQANSVAAITALDTAIDSVNTERSDMGALVNRLEHAINNLYVSNSNQQAAESLIRDVDFASETADYTRNQILIQSGTAMLAQANMVPQSVLQLLG
jgi:flagellin